KNFLNPKNNTFSIRTPPNILRLAGANIQYLFYSKLTFFEIF
ncbi:MAG: hypothetical protein ACJAZK_001877, partial [Psychroserpens sp.]